MTDAITGLFRVVDLAQKAGKVGQLASVLSNVAITANAVAKIGDVTRLSQYLAGNQFDAAKLAKDGYVLETVNGQQVVKATKDITISAEMVESLLNVAKDAPVKVTGVPSYLQKVSNEDGSPAPISNAQMAAAEQTGETD
ncbi:hypothetical protein NO1_1813 [Candidatus Termititenax aidoneus]|uniref:Uncharacterized protein n=1 Tax=Termititenax aidoneus TaxID=2218524 RepID=A0A388TCS7_TERA1|nr:hypothetical protein NO1_1813 [Candidatus Termititenax aidoneus]